MQLLKCHGSRHGRRPAPPPMEGQSVGAMRADGLAGVGGQGRGGGITYRGSPEHAVHTIASGWHCRRQASVSCSRLTECGSCPLVALMKRRRVPSSAAAWSSALS